MLLRGYPYQAIALMGLVGFLGIHMVHFGIRQGYVGFCILCYVIECMLSRLLQALVVPYLPSGKTYLFYGFVVVWI
jgi:hypothetical protein